jgi:hypothetical protein
MQIHHDRLLVREADVGMRVVDEVDGFYVICAVHGVGDVCLSADFFPGSADDLSFVDIVNFMAPFL